MRRKLTTIIVDHLMVVYGQDLKNSHFKAVAEVIVEIFPTEHAVRTIPISVPNS